MAELPEGGRIIRSCLGWGAACNLCNWRTDGNDWAWREVASRLLNKHHANAHPESPVHGSDADI